MYINESSFEIKSEIIALAISNKVQDYYGIEPGMSMDFLKELIVFTKIKCKEIIEEDEKMQLLMSEIEAEDILYYDITSAYRYGDRFIYENKECEAVKPICKGDSLVLYNSETKIGNYIEI